ncbi:MAG: type I restriction endonuclease subunit R [Actinomycetaceae bacterium]|nr:type I restriction endonuclease subunit R [Actinomycetaceae bacterium]
MIEKTGGNRFEPVVVGNESTVVAKYEASEKDVNAQAYQSEGQLETQFIAMLQGQAYEYVGITSEAGLITNLRAQLEALNDYRFTDSEWASFYASCIAGANEGIVEKTKRIQEDHVQLLRRDNGETKNIYLIDKANVHNNRLQVINQYEVPQGSDSSGAAAGGGQYANRYDVTILLNGLPVVHVELKRRGVDIREAFNQIERYQRESFWAGSGLYEYVQLFVISNGTLTKYYSNTTRQQHVDGLKGSSTSGKGAKTAAKSSHSFEFTSWWADATNKPLQDLVAFTRTFFAKHTLLNVLTKYCVFTSEQTLMVMRPYQIVAAERILQRIQQAINYKKLGSVEAGGYVWHTTGSGKTLTSFKAAQLASRMDGVSKVLFVVDRKDLDYQTMREYDRFEKGAANSNTSTAVLTRQLGDPSARIIITTIQKLALFVERNKGHAVTEQNIVIIFDECHRSQFGDMHRDITKAFKKYALFGFTGTPIFAENSTSGGNPQLKTTQQAFGDKLHTYTIVDAIRDRNVLPFRIDYINTVLVDFKSELDRKVRDIDRDAALDHPIRRREIVAYILEHFDQKTRRSEHYVHKGVAKRGFNALFATASIEAARAYYREFTNQQAEVLEGRRLKIAMIYSYGANDPASLAGVDGLLAEEGFETDALESSAREDLEAAIGDYNRYFQTSFDTSSEKFQNYYKDLSARIKNQEIDLVIVVNMFLTGFDATTLNTLFVDKNLRAHGLVQAFSRTNRILNSVKTYGNIVSFRAIEQETNDAIALFGNENARGIVLLKPYDDYYKEYAAKVADLGCFELVAAGEGGSEDDQKEFIKLFGSILRLENILQSFDDFEGNELLSARQSQDYRSVYLNLHEQFKQGKNGDKESIHDDVLFEIELVKQVEINVDYILMMVEKYRAKRGDGEDKELRAQILGSVDASPSLRSKRDLVEAFVDSVSTKASVAEDWKAFVDARREAELGQIIADENLKDDAARAFVEAAFRDGHLRVSGTGIGDILKPVTRFGGREAIKNRVVQRLQAFFERFYNLISLDPEN